MVRDYSGLDPRAALGGTDLGAVASLWNMSEIMQVDQTIRQLQQGEQVSYADLDQATQSAQRGLRHPTYARPSLELIEAMFHLNTAAEGKAHVVGNLLGPDNVGLLRSLTAEPGDSLVKRLGPQGIQRLLKIAGNADPLGRVKSLRDWAREERVADLPRRSSDAGELERQIQPGGLDLAPEFVRALEENNLETLRARITEATNPHILARAAALLGEQARIPLSQLALDSDPLCREFAVQALQLLAESNLDQAQPLQPGARTASTDVRPGGRQSVGAIIDATALEDILSAPDSLPASLAADFGCSPALQAGLLELIVRNLMPITGERVAL